MKKMKKQFEIAAVMVAIMVLSVLMVHPVMSGLGDENTTNVTKTNEDSMAKYFYLDTEGTKISTAITNKTNVSERDFLISMAVTGNLVGTIVFYSDRDGDEEIYVMNPDGTNVTKLTINTARDIHPAWFPDCKKVAFSSDRDGDFEIYVMDSDGTNVVQLTNNTALDREPDISSDGSKIAFSSDMDGDDEIYVMTIYGTNFTKLTINTADDSSPAWSPDGSKIVFCSDRDGDYEIYVMDADGTNVVRLTRNIGYEIHPAWSPDGSKIAFSSDMDGDFEIYAMDTDGTNVVQLTRTASVNQLPAWSPDGKRIAFTSSRDGDNEVYVMDADGTHLTQLTINTAEDVNSNWRSPRVWDSGIYVYISTTQVNNFSISYSYSCSGSHGLRTVKHVYPPIDIIENKFQYYSDDEWIYGEFTSPNFATGTYRGTWRDWTSPWMVTCDSGKITWSARRVVQTTGDININEIMYNPPGVDTDNEWLELYNNDTTDIDIKGWRFYAAGVNHSLTLVQGSRIIPAGGYAIIVDNATTFLDEYQECNCTVVDSAFSLNNSGEYIALKNATLGIIDEVAYNTSWGADGNGRTLELNATGGWVESSVDRGTPCQQNSVLAVDYSGE
jgi:Tol biopolymer transport system component